MKPKKINKQQIFLIIIVLFVVLFSYLKIFSGFFQQDEWFSFGYQFLLKSQGIRSILNYFFLPSVGHYQPLNSLIVYVLSSLFGIVYFPYASVSLFLHLVVTFLVYLLAKQIFKNDRLSFLTALLFGLSASTHQATSWVLADLGVHLATIFGIICLIVFLKFIETRKLSRFILSIIFLILSLLCKEIAVGFFIFLPLTYFLFSPQGFKSSKKYPLIIIFIGALYIIFRIWAIFIPAAYVNDTLAIRSQTVSDIIYNLVTFPIKGLVQSILPINIILDTLKYVLSLVGNQVFDSFVQDDILEIFNFFCFAFILIIALVFWVRSKDGYFKKVLLFALLFVVLNSPVFAMAPEKSGKILIFDSRNLYLIAVGTSFFIISLFALALKKNFNRVICFIFPLLMLNFAWLNNQLNELEKEGRIREQILGQIRRDYPKLPSRTIFYTESDLSYYGLSSSERILPFQSGFGQTLLVWYQSVQHFPSYFFQSRFLWDITEQGYRNYNSQGFGYFRYFELMAEVVKEKNIPLESIIAFRYSSLDQKVEDITKEVQGRIRGFLAKKSEVNLDKLLFSFPNNFDQGKFVHDGKRETFWESKFPYAIPQSLKISFENKVKIAQIQIDSYNNKDQNEVGYKVSIAGKDGNWEKVSYARRYPPDEGGIVNLYFEPKITDKIKIEQVGYHDFAPWVIHELKLYEAVD